MKNWKYLLNFVPWVALLPLTGLGCNQKLGAVEVLKAPKEKIIASEVQHIPTQRVKTPTGQLSATGTPLFNEIIIPAKDIVEYQYVSDEVAQAKPYFDKPEYNLTNAERLPNNAIAFYAQPKFYRELNKIYNVKSATTTLVDFLALTSISLSDRIRNFFINTAVATATFNASSTYTPDETGTINLLVVGGGGGGGGTQGGGGGAGGYQASSTYPVSVQSYTVTVGQGGVGGSGDAKGVNGATSSFGAVTSTGGGGGGAANSENGLNGGSGGGGGSGVCNGTGGTGIVGQGKNGGNAPSSGCQNGAGGGGAFQVGATAANDSTVGGKGGDGISNPITGASTTYAGGGGGGATNGGTGGAGGLGGGGAGTGDCAVAAGAGTANTGGGGGGDCNTAALGGRGGDGVIIIGFNSSTPAAVFPKKLFLMFE